MFTGIAENEDQGGQPGRRVTRNVGEGPTQVAVRPAAQSREFISKGKVWGDNGGRRTHSAGPGGPRAAGRGPQGSPDSGMTRFPWSWTPERGLKEEAGCRDAGGQSKGRSVSGHCWARPAAENEGAGLQPNTPPLGLASCSWNSGLHTALELPASPWALWAPVPQPLWGFRDPIRTR